MSASVFTQDGILLGAAEYGAYAAFARMIVVAFVSGLVLRLFFAHRIGLYLTAELSSKAGLQIFWANLTHPSNRHIRSRLQVIALFTLAFFVTRGLDIVTSTYTASTQGSRTRRITFTQTANTAPDARPAIRTVTIQRPFNRTDVYHALHKIVKGAVDPLQPIWPKTVGSLSDAEVAAITLTRDESMCSPADVGPPPPPFDSDASNTTSLVMSDFKALRLRAMSLFGEDVELLSLWFGAQPNGPNSWITIPVPISFIAGQEGQEVISQQLRRQFGVLSTRGSNLIAYDMECGLTPERVETWLREKQQRPRDPPRTSFNRNGSTLWYADVIRTDTADDDDTRGWAASLLMDVTKEAYQRGEWELLTFGSPIRGWYADFRTSLLPLSNAIRGADMTADQVVTYTTLADALPDVPARQFNCTVVDSAMGIYRPRRPQSLISDPDLDLNPWIHRGPAKRLGTGVEYPVTRCSIDFGPHPQNRTARVMHYYHDPSNRGVQICRLKLQSSYSVQDSDLLGSRDGFVDLIASAQFAPIARKQSAQVQCFPPGKSLTPVSLPLASSANGRWGVIVNNALQDFNKTTVIDKNGAQAWFLDVVVVPWWELGVVVVFALLLVLLGSWDDLAEVVTIIMYSFAFRPTPPSVGQSQTRQKQHVDGDARVPLNNGVMGINLLQKMTYAVVKYDLRGDGTAQEVDSSAAADIRVIPTDWNVQPGDSMSLDVFARTTETVLATGIRVSSLIQSVHQSRPMSQA